MGTSIELTIAGISLSYSKNHMGLDFGFLFQDGDEARRKLDGINYEYYDEHPEENADLAEHEAVFARPLARVLPRLRLLGSTIESARAEYEAIIADPLEIGSYRTPPEEPNLLSFEEFCSLACRYSLATLGGGTEFDDDEKAKGNDVLP